MCTPTYFLMKYNPQKGFWMTINYKINHVVSIWNSFYWCHLPRWPHHVGMASIQANFKLWPIFRSIYLIPTLNLRPGLNSAVKFPAFKLLSFMAYTYNIQGWWDGTRRWPPSCWPASRWILKFGPFFSSIYLIPTLNLRPGLNSVAFFTYIVKFPAFKLLSFMAYTYNIQGWWDGTRHQPPWWPHQKLAPWPTPWQPHSLMSTLTLSRFNLININYNLWLHILNVVEGLMWIGKNSLNNFICHFSWLKKLPLLIHIPLYPLVNFWNPVIFFLS